jgi:Flp pilus assembly protein TadG
MKTNDILIDEGGTATLEFALAAATFFLLLIMVIAGGVLFFTRSALVETTRRAARYAATQAATSPAGSSLRTTNGCDTTGPSVTAIKNYALYGNAAGTGSKLVSDLQASNICIEYSSFGVGSGTVSVSITGYDFIFKVPGINQTITMPPFRTTLNGESAGASPS